VIVVFAGALPIHAAELSLNVANPTESAMQKILSETWHYNQLTRMDCSHFVHAVYEAVGLDYPYATSRKLYHGIQPFRRVARPDSGDLVVWRGHVGIVADPVRHRFLSSLRKGVRISSYSSKYWVHAGHLRFFRYTQPKTYVMPVSR
jgi:cell wall-associated NlpC family hydrolase